MSQGAQHECWLCTASWVAWAVLHTVERHECSVEECDVYTVRVSRRHIRRRRRGRWSTTADQEYRVEAVSSYGEWALAHLEGGVA